MGGYKPKAHTRNDPSGSADRFRVPPLGLVSMDTCSICSRCEQTLGKIKYKIRTGFLAELLSSHWEHINLTYFGTVRWLRGGVPPCGA